ncbi:MAG: nuclear transport factor 2 family protein [Cyanobacteria bacterium P01_H01_bin.26]
MKRLTASLFLVAMLLLGALVPIVSVSAQEAGGDRTTPMTSQDQGMNYQNTIPREFTTEIIVVDDEGRARAEEIIEIYNVLSTDPSIDNMRKYLSDNYIQHNTVVPDGAEAIAMLFSSSVAQYPVEIDVHKVMVVGDWAMAHVNFRNLDTTDPEDLGTAAVDMYLYGPDGKVEEHWDVLQGVPTHSANPNGMFLKVFKD